MPTDHQNFWTSEYYDGRKYFINLKKRPIALLDVDRKLLVKILARRLEGILPDMISMDQTGFILGCNSCHNVRRLLNLIQHGTKSKTHSLLISLDAEKAFDRIK